MKLYRYLFLIILLSSLPAVVGAETTSFNIGRYWQLFGLDTTEVTGQYTLDVHSQWKTVRDYTDQLHFDQYLGIERLRQIDNTIEAGLATIRDSLESPMCFPIRDKKFNIVAWKMTPATYTGMARRMLKYKVVADMFHRMYEAYVFTAFRMLDSQDEVARLKSELLKLKEAGFMPSMDVSDVMVDHAVPKGKIAFYDRPTVEWYYVPIAVFVGSVTTYLILSTR